MPEIGDSRAGATLINVFETDPDNQEVLIDEIRKNVETMGEIPGFVSFSLHQSLDGERVVNYVQFESREAFEEVQQSRDWEDEMGEAMAKTEVDPHFYEVVLTHEAGE